MLSEKLMDELESIQNSICLEPEKKLEYAVSVALRYDCDDICGIAAAGCPATC